MDQNFIVILAKSLLGPFAALLTPGLDWELVVLAAFVSIGLLYIIGRSLPLKKSKNYSAFFGSIFIWLVIGFAFSGGFLMMVSEG